MKKKEKKFKNTKVVQSDQLWSALINKKEKINKIHIIYNKGYNKG